MVDSAHGYTVYSNTEPLSFDKNSKNDSLVTFYITSNKNILIRINAHRAACTAGANARTNPAIARKLINFLNMLLLLYWVMPVFD